MFENQVPLPVLIGEKVLWLGSGSGEPKSGKVLWIGRLAEISGNDWTLGLELDESLPYGGIDGKWRGRKLFDCKPKHGLLVPASSILSTKGRLPFLDPVRNEAEDELSKNLIRYRGQESFCGSLYSHVKPKPAVRKKHQQCIKSDRNNNTCNEAVLGTDFLGSSVSLMSNSSPSVPVIPPRNKDVVKFCKLFGYSDPTNIIIDDRHFQLYNEAKNNSAVLNFSTEIEGNQNGIRIRKTMSAYYGNEEPNLSSSQESKKVSSLQSVKRLFSKSSTSQTSISAASSAASDCSSQEKRLSGLFSFFRWFNKDKRKDSLSYTDCDRLPPESAFLQFKQTPVHHTGSVDSVYSTATCNSFFYVPPSRYKSKYCIQRRIPYDSETDTYRNRVKQFERSRETEQKISLRKKYKLLGSALTLHSSVDNVSLCDRGRIGSNLGLSSLNSTLQRRKRQAPPPPPPVIREASPQPSPKEPLQSGSSQWKNHRRSSSESSKDKRAGAYFHVKGKRKAPQPPSFLHRNQTLPRNLTIGSTRKKRLAPQPPKRNSAIFPSSSFDLENFTDPKSSTNDQSHTDIVEDPEEKTDDRTQLNADVSPSSKIEESVIKSETEVDCSNIDLEEGQIETNAAVRKKNGELLTKADKQKLFEDFEKLEAHNKKHFTGSELPSERLEMAQSVCNDSLKLEKGILKPNKADSGAESKIVEDRVVPPPSPVSPRPWYKRTVQSTSISHSMNKSNLLEKLKHLEKNKVETSEANDLPEVSSSRTMKIGNESGSRLGLSPNVSSPTSENKRRSQLSILTNISELDREAAEIVRNERLRNSRLISVENEKFYDSKLELPSYHPSETTNSCSASSQKKTSARDLISLFNAISNVTKVTVNTAFFTKDSLSLFSKDSGDKKSSFSKSKKTPTKKTSYVPEPSCNVPSVPNREEHLDDSIFVNLHALDDIEPKLNESKNLCEEVMTEFDIRKSRTQELFEINRQRRHHSPSPSIPTITEMSESISGSTTVASMKIESPSPPAQVKPIEQTQTAIEQTQAAVEQTQVASASSYNAVWSCPRCTLQNPMWRILCDACHLFRTTISVNPIEPPVIKPVDLSLSPRTRVASFANTSDLKNSSESASSEQVSNTSESSSNVSKDKEAPKDGAVNLNKSSTGTVNKEAQSSSAVEAPSINFAEAKMKFSRASESESKNLIESKKLPPKNNLISEKLGNVSSASAVVDDTTINTNTREEKLIRDKVVLSNSAELVEVRKARLAFFDKKGTENNLNKKIEDGPENSKANKDMDHAEREKLKVMLREMKHSLTKQDSTEEKNGSDNTAPTAPSLANDRRFGAIKKVKKVDLDSKKLSYKKVEDYLDGIQSEKTAEAYLVTSDVIFEDVKIKSSDPSTSADKVSTSVQTSSVVRKMDLPPNILNKSVENGLVIAPVIIEKYNIKDGKVKSSVKRDTRSISMSAFELIRAQDFADLKSKPPTHALSPVYANIPSDASVSECYSQISDLVPSKSSNLSSSQTQSFDSSASTSTTTSNNAYHAPPENVTTLAINRLLRRLETAIAKGQHHQAAALAKELARLKISCSVVRQKPLNAKASNDITVSLFVEDKVSHQGPFSLTVHPGMKVSDLKLKIEADYEIPVRFQRWILGKELVTDNSRTLQQLGVAAPGFPFFLYLVAPESTKQEASQSSLSDPKLFNHQQKSTTVASAPLLSLSSSETDDLSLPENTTSGISNILEEVVEEDISEELDNADASLIENDQQLPEPGPNVIHEADDLSLVVCNNLRLEDKQISSSHIDEKSKNQEAAVKITEEAGTSAEVKLSNYHELLNLDKSDLIPNVDEFECPVCFSTCKSREGVVLRECLHTFCKGCLAQMVEFCEEAEVKCPFQDTSYSCDSVIQEREIKALVTAEQYELHLAKSIAQAETKIGNTFHCKTPDCRGWCIFEDNVNYFLCPVCNRNNCLTCQAIHSGINCKQYQEQMREESETNVDAKRTRDMLEEMVERGEAMACPSCQVVLMKKWGCDWVRCSMCKTEICWVRRCARWGPKGRGDTTGGCQCGVNGIKCHPKCTYCH
ncbi:uncharacterized protein [Bemisia tabaci]|uniref:uncharacterized protein isoform X2 n=1 Tax=Bemisia tabaci TaxID=7038 RepID=UPI003B282F8C